MYLPKEPPIPVILGGAKNLKINAVKERPFAKLMVTALVNPNEIRSRGGYIDAKIFSYTDSAAINKRRN